MTINENIPPSIYIQKLADKRIARIKIMNSSAYTYVKNNLFVIILGVLDCDLRF